MKKCLSVLIFLTTAVYLFTGCPHDTQIHPDNTSSNTPSNSVPEIPEGLMAAINAVGTGASYSKYELRKGHMNDSEKYYIITVTFDDINSNLKDRFTNMQADSSHEKSTVADDTFTICVYYIYSIRGDESDWGAFHPGGFFIFR